MHKRVPRPTALAAMSATPICDVLLAWAGFQRYDVAVHPDSSDEELMARLKGKGKGKGVGGGGGKKGVIEDSEEESEEEEESEGDESGDGKEEEEGEEELDSGREQGGLKTFEGNREECKLVLVVRTDLGMGKGKIAAQCAHATLACYKQLLLASTSPSSLLRRWEATGQAKIAVQVASEEALERLRAQAVGLGLCAQVVRDAGRTQVASGSATVLGVGPGPRGVVDGVTGGLRLL
ncbi:MAG: hypothetical protein ASARMPREDX12_000429 [Alectoria sarmentosa]|nr:MAG: hypothetical protein ASARMPREDX12_000429 [Alectoria sarmentosa]